MELTNEFEVAVPIEVAWAVLTDAERIAPCLPGAELREVEGDEYRGVVKVKVGPITASYQGTARFTELDESGHRAVLRAEGRETRGQGNATAEITASMMPSGSGTKVSVLTDLSITGKVAQFGRGVLADVSTKLLDQFVTNLEASVLGPDEVAVPVEVTALEGQSDLPGPDPSPAIRHIDSAQAEPVDLVAVAGSSVARRLRPLLIIAGIVVVIGLATRSRRRRRSAPDRLTESIAVPT
jgi:carbon monoxide dehydrogenase subunit G